MQIGAKLALSFALCIIFFGCASPDSKQENSASLTQVNDTLYSFSMAGKKGFKNTKGSVVIQPVYEDVLTDTFKNKIAFVLDTNFWAIDKRGRRVVRPFIIDNGPDYIQEGLFRYVQNKKIGYVNADGEVKIKARFDGAFPFHNNRAAVCIKCKEITSGEVHYWQGGKWGYVDKMGRLAIDTLYSQASTFENGRAVVYKNKTELLIDTLGHFTTHK